MLPQSTIDRITKEAEAFYPYIQKKNKQGEVVTTPVGSNPFGWGKLMKQRGDYIKIATAYEEKIYGLVEALGDLINLSEIWGREWFNNEDWAKIQEAQTVLNNYKQ